MYDTPHWSDEFTFTKKQEYRVKDLLHDFLDEAADVCDLDTTEWEKDDYDILQEIIHYDL